MIGVLLLSGLFVVGVVVLPSFTTAYFVTFIIAIPTLACLGIATCHSSTLESAKALRAYKKLKHRLAEAEGSQITLDRFFSLSSDLMAVAGQDGYLKKASTSLIKTLGYSEDTLLNTPFFEFIHPDDRDSTRKNIEQLNQGMNSVGFENRYRAADGTYRTLSWSAAADAELGVRFASARDVTDERSFQKRTQLIMDASPFLLMVKDSEGTITSCNQAFSNYIGVPKDSLLGRSAKHFLTAESITSGQEKEAEVLKTNQPVTFEETLFSHGKAVKHLSTVFPIQDPSGKVSIGKISLNISSIPYYL